MPAARTKGVESARRALQILLQFSEGRPELTVDQILEAHAISVPSAYRYVALLREMNLIEERGRGVFTLSPQVVRLARAAEASFDYRVEAQPILDRMRERTGESALYVRRVNDAAVCLSISESEHAIGLSFQPGALMPLHGGAAAKVLLADYPEPKRTQYLDRLSPPLSRSARRALEADLDRIRAAEYSESTGEVDQGVWAAAAPVRAHGALVGAVTVAAPAYRLDAEHRREIAAAVIQGASELARAIARG
ncbi:IclR family transcriptional regulator [Microbacterium marinilacus]|uniref:IclR family transcriptional regulator n=1 Tax=Microbacterium marinilacus TaxID=415209 RepID=UPI001C8EF947|nr:IclR family transcriptional regulator [Microbacterium marinilacus]MBY0689654.1 IclR family transcriptional regulator [Microbacterium marinilacus]